MMVPQFSPDGLLDTAAPNASQRASQNAPPSPSAPRGVAVLGSTGSIGTQTLEVLRLFPDRFRVRALTAGSNAALLAQQARQFEPDCVAIDDHSKGAALREALAGMGTRVLVGEEGLCEAAARPGVDTVMAAVVGVAGLRPVLAALQAGKTVALANKETLVVGGALVQAAIGQHGGALIPVDSEHSAIFQCLAGEPKRTIEELILTASGGPFRSRPAHTFDAITKDEALDHPNWEMGAKITIDSATMMNKGLEVIEAHWLFGVEPEQIRVLVHPQSIVHSMVSFADGAIKAQLGVPDMKVPIQYAFSYPARWPAPHERLDFDALARLDFAPPDLKKFPALRLAFEALEAGGGAPAVLNAANEAAVALFLDEAIRFVDIPRLIEAALAAKGTLAAPGSVDELNALDAETRALVNEQA